jgi:hypothetical protein
VAGDDLRGRPPERLGARLRPAEEARRPAREQEAAKHRAKRPRLELRACERRDRLRRRVGLLRGDPALLDREARGVAGGEHALDALDAAVLVDRDEAVGGRGEPVDASPAQARHRDHPVDLQRVVAREAQLPVADVERVGAGVQLDPACVELLPHGRARGLPEELERLLLGRHERDLHVARGRQERELVRRQRPARAPRDDERDPPHGAGVDLGQQRAELLRVRRSAEGQRARHRRRGNRAVREEEDVVGHRPARHRARDPAHRVGRPQRAERQPRSRRRGEVAEVEVPRLAEPERLRDGERAVPEVRLGSEQLNVDAPVREGAQRERGLERGHAAAGDQHRCCALAGHDGSLRSDDLSIVDRFPIAGIASRPRTGSVESRIEIPQGR